MDMQGELKVSGVAFGVVLSNLLLNQLSFVPSPKSAIAFVQATELQDLPDEILAGIAAKLTVKEIFSWRLANKYFDNRIAGFLGQVPMMLVPSKDITAGRLDFLCHAFPGATGLDVSRSTAPSLHDDVLLNIPRGLKLLDLAHCRWVHEDGVAHLARLKNLEDLHMDFCQDLETWNLESLPKSLSRLGHLSVLSTSALFPEPEMLCGFSNLTELTIRTNQEFAGFPMEMSSFQVLERLAVDNCPSCVELCGILSLPALKDLTITFCPVSVTESISQLSSLTRLELSGSAIVSMPDTLGHLRQLEELDLSYNDNFAHLPESVSALQALSALDLSYCPDLESLPTGLGSLTRLTCLKLEGCAMGHVDFRGCVISFGG